MQKVNRLRGKRRYVVFLLAALLIVVADQLTKIWIRSNLAIGQSLPEAGFFQLTHVQNTGGVFGLFQGQSFPLIIVASVVMAVLLLYVLFICRRFPFLNSVLSILAIGLVLGGTVGNLIDRLRFGYVTDFVDVGLWPAFNIADSAVTVGAIILACFFLSLARAEEQ